MRGDLRRALPEMGEYLDGLTDFDPLDGEEDLELADVYRAFRAADPSNDRFASTFRNTLDQLYDGQRTGRFSWAALCKTERTHCGTLVEINLRREFADVISDGTTLDYEVAGNDLDCKFSQTMGGWMVPPEARGKLLLVLYARDETSEFAVGVVRARPEYLRGGANRDAKAGLNPRGRDAIRWLSRDGALPPNVLLQADRRDTDAIFDEHLSGQARVNELFRRLTGRRITRNVVATVAQQADSMKRVRQNGGARSTLRLEGIVILGGDYAEHRRYARELGVEVPRPGEMVSLFVAPASEEEPNTIEVAGELWRVCQADEATHIAPVLDHRASA